MHLIPVLLVTWLNHLVQLQLSLFLCEATVTMLVALFPLTMVSSKYNSSPSSYFKFANFKSLFSSNVKVSSLKKLSSAMLGQVERSRSSSTRFNFALDFCSRFPVPVWLSKSHSLFSNNCYPVTHVLWQFFFSTATLSNCKSCPAFSLFFLLLCSRNFYHSETKCNRTAILTAATLQLCPFNCNFTTMP